LATTPQDSGVLNMMNPPLIYDTGDDIHRLMAIMDTPHDTPIHLTTSIYPLPEELVKLQNIVYLHLKESRKTNATLNNISEAFEVISQFLQLETLICEVSLYREYPDSFYNLINLKHLIMPDAQFYMSKEIVRLSKLETIEITWGRGELPETIGELQHLKRLIFLDKTEYLMGHSTIKVPQTIWTLTKLRELRIGPAYGKYLNAERMLDLTQLEVFEFLVDVKTIPDSFWQLPNLREVSVWASEQEKLPSLADTKIKSLGLNMETLSSIPILPEVVEKFALQSNAITEFPSLENTNIRDLSLAGYKLAIVPKLPLQLEALKLKQMSIAELPELPKSITSLNIEFCSQLTHLPNSLHLKYLWLSNCYSLPHLPAGLVVDTLIIDFCENLHELPDDLVVLSRLQMTGMNIQQMPEFPDHVQVLIFEDY
jgi:hypothetical protein